MPGGLLFSSSRGMFGGLPLIYYSVTGCNLLHFRSSILFAMAAIAIGSLCYLYKVGPFRPSLSRGRYLAIREVIRTTPSPRHRFRATALWRPRRCPRRFAAHRL
jgi:hypothetical protein